MKAAKGFTLIELGMVIALMAILAGFATMAWTGLDENRDATLVQATQANLQAVISQGSARMDRDPTWLYANQAAGIQNAMRALLQESAGSGTTFTVAGNTATLAINSTGRQARFDMDTSGNVTLGGLTGNWQQYFDAGDVIAKN